MEPGETLFYLNEADFNDSYFNYLLNKGGTMPRVKKTAQVKDYTRYAIWALVAFITIIGLCTINLASRVVELETENYVYSSYEPVDIEKAYQLKGIK